MALVIAWLACASAPVRAGEGVLDNVLPVPAFAEGWAMDGKVTLYDRETLFDRIDGEAELYFPYGFDVLASARYANRQDPRIAVDADVFRMGSPLDAFGIYANYRRRDDIDADIGAEGTLSSSQMIFYQDRYFVRLQATGAASLGREVFLACARAISRSLPRHAGRPRELEAFMIPAMARKSERYIAQSLLGYDFFRRGLVGDAVLDGEQVQLFVVPEDSSGAASRAFDRYRSFLGTSGQDVRTAGIGDVTSLMAVDPLYGNVYVEQAGRFLVGAVRVRNASAAKKAVEQLRTRFGGG